MSGRPHPSNDPVSCLRYALAGPYPDLRRAAERRVRRALKAPTVGEAAERLGVPRRGFERLRADFPEAFALEKK